VGVSDSDSKRLGDFSALTQAFGNRNYAIYIAGNATSLTGYWMKRLAVGWLVWLLTKSGFWLGLVAFADLFPAVVLGPLAGVLTDRWNHRRMLIALEYVNLGQTIVLSALVLADLITIEMLLVLTIVGGSAAALQDAVRLAIVHGLVDTRDLPAAIGINAGAFNIARFAGPAIAGIVVSQVGIAAAISGHAVSAIAFIVCLYRLEITGGNEHHDRAAGFLSDLVSGLKYSASHQAITPLLLLFLASTLLVRPVYELMPGIVDTVFARGPEGLATCISSIGLGSIVAGLYLAKRGSGRGLVPLAIVGAAITAISLLLFLLISWFWVAVFILFVLGLSMTICAIAVQILIQLSVADGMRGRVLALWAMIIRGAPAVGALVMGWLAGYSNFQLPLFVGAVLCLVATGFVLPKKAAISAAIKRD
jgi:MFS family permease